MSRDDTYQVLVRTTAGDLRALITKPTLSEALETACTFWERGAADAIGYERMFIATPYYPLRLLRYRQPAGGMMEVVENF